jgi:hypothetical protein
MRGIAIVGVASAIILALFAVLGSKLMAAAVLAVAGAAWWGVGSGLAEVLHRKADSMQREAESRAPLSPRELGSDSRWQSARR